MDTPDWEIPRREPLVTSEQVAEYLRVTRQTVQRWTRADVDPLPVRKCGHRGFRRYRLSEIEAWLERRKYGVLPPELRVPDEPAAFTRDPQESARTRKPLTLAHSASEMSSMEHVTMPRGRPRKTVPKPTSTIVMDDSAKIRTIRAMLGLSQMEFCSRLGISTRTLTNWERAGRTPQQKNRAELEALWRSAGGTFTSSGYPIPAD